MQCEHRYFSLKEGVLRCQGCGKTADEVKQAKKSGTPQVENKLGERPAVKEPARVPALKNGRK